MHKYCCQLHELDAPGWFCLEEIDLMLLYTINLIIYFLGTLHDMELKKAMVVSIECISTNQGKKMQLDGWFDTR